MRLFINPNMNTETTNIVKYYEDSEEGYKRWSQVPEGIDVPYALHTGYHVPGKVQTPYESIQEMNDNILRLLEINEEGLTIVDAGCGVGNLAYDIAKKYVATNVYGINITERQIYLAEGYRERAGLGNLSYLASDYSYIPFSNNQVDRIAFVESLTHSTEVGVTLSEACRVLKVGGLVVVCDSFIDDEGLMEEDILLEKDLKNGMHLHGLLRKKALLEAMSTSGLTISVLEDITQFKMVSAIRMGENAAKKLVEDTSAPQGLIDNRKASYAAYKLMQKGLMHFYWAVLRKEI